jgi:hypothetical protein
MKIVSSTLGLYILFLALLPVILTPNDNGKKHTISSVSHSCQKQFPSKTTQGSTKRRTPFFGCPKTHVVVPSSVDAGPIFVTLEKQDFVYVASNLSQGFYETWLPPKIV